MSDDNFIVHSKTHQAVLLLLIRFLVLLKLWGFCVCTMFCCMSSVLCPFLVLKSSLWRRDSWLLYLVFLVSRDCYCSVALLHGTVGWASECDCGIA